MHSANDEHFDFKAQLQTLSEEEAVEYAKRYFDQNCEATDAAYLAEIVTAGERSVEVTYQHAINGSPVAQLVYGLNTLQGNHTPQCISEGLFWLRRACNNGNAKAALLLAGTYLQGEHVRANPERALEYASVAAERDLAEGKYMLASLLIDDQATEAQQTRAIALLQSAARQGYTPARKLLDDKGIALDEPAE